MAFCGKNGAHFFFRPLIYAHTVHFSFIAGSLAKDYLLCCTSTMVQYMSTISCRLPADHVTAHVSARYYESSIYVLTCAVHCSMSPLSLSPTLSALPVLESYAYAPISRLLPDYHNRSTPQYEVQLASRASRPSLPCQIRAALIELSPFEVLVYHILYSLVDRCVDYDKYQKHCSIFTGISLAS